MLRGLYCKSVYPYYLPCSLLKQSTQKHYPLKTEWQFIIMRFDHFCFLVQGSRSSHSQKPNLVILPYHDDVIKWTHFPRYWPFVRVIHRSPVNSPHKGQWRGALRFSLICAWIDGWVNNREAGDLRRQRAHYDVIVIWSPCISRYDINGHGNSCQIEHVFCPKFLWQAITLYEVLLIRFHFENCLLYLLQSFQTLGPVSI